MSADADAYDEIGRFVAIDNPEGPTFEAEVRSRMRRELVVREARERLRAWDEPEEEVDIGTLAEMLARPAPPPHRVAGLIPYEASTLLAAQRKCGKTTVLVNLSRSMLTGEPFLDRFDVQPLTGSVAILNFEVTGHTLAVWAEQHRVPRDRLVIVNLRGRSNPLATPERRDRLAQLLRSRETECLMTDVFGAAFTGHNENDNGEVRGFLTMLDRFARQDVGAKDLILSAHAGWGTAERSRGASALEDWPDSILTLTKDGEGDDAPRFLRAMGRDVSLEEDRLDYHAPTRTLRMSGAGSRERLREHHRLAPLSVLVRRAVAQEEGIGVGQIEAAIRGMDDAPRLRNGDVSKAARFAAERGLMRIEPGGLGLRTRHFTATPPTHPNPSPEGVG